MNIDSYDDKYLLQMKSVKEALQHGTANDGEDDNQIHFPANKQGENVEPEQSVTATASLTNENIMTIKED